MRLDPVATLGDQLASRAAEPAAGPALCATGALAAALISKACLLSPDAGLEDELARAGDLRSELLATGERDFAAFAAILDARRSGGDEHAAWAMAAIVLRDAAALLEETRFLAEDVAKRCRPALSGEPIAAALLAAGAHRAALALAEIDEAG
jgi:hypothetical protein